MSIIQTVDFNLFKQAFKNSNRDSNFTSRGLELLFDLLESLSDSTGENIELDVIRLCCEYSENTLLEFINNYADCQSNFEEAEQEYIHEYLNEYLHNNLDKLLKDPEIINTYFQFFYNDNYYYITAKNELYFTSMDKTEIIQMMQDHLIDSMDYRKFLKLICEIENNQDYMEAIDSIMYDVVTEYLDYAGGLYMISDCRTIVVYQDF